jgi:hypothetical protein
MPVCSLLTLYDLFPEMDAVTKRRVRNRLVHALHRWRLLLRKLSLELPDKAMIMPINLELGTVIYQIAHLQGRTKLGNGLQSCRAELSLVWDLQQVVIPSSEVTKSLWPSLDH